MTREDLTDYETATSLFILAKMHRRVAHQSRVEANLLARKNAERLRNPRSTANSVLYYETRISELRKRAGREDDKAAFYQRAGQLALIGADALAHEAREMATFTSYPASVGIDPGSSWEGASFEEITADLSGLVAAVNPVQPAAERPRDKLDWPSGLAITRDCLDCDPVPPLTIRSKTQAIDAKGRPCVPSEDGRAWVLLGGGA